MHPSRMRTASIVPTGRACKGVCMPWGMHAGGRMYRGASVQGRACMQVWTCMQGCVHAWGMYAGVSVCRVVMHAEGCTCLSAGGGACVSHIPCGQNDRQV